MAVIYVPELEGNKPFPIEFNNVDLIGQEVIAFGNPSGYHNIVSKGYILGEKKHLYIDSYIYEDLYKISSPIFPGSSGGPLVSQELGKIIAINTAKDQIDSDIGLSIPLYKVHELIQSWINEPMSKQSISAKFKQPYQDLMEILLRKFYDPLV